MNLNLNNITFVIVTYRSEEVIYKCINSLPKKSKIIIIENSKSIKLKKKLKKKYGKITVILNNNTGMGAGNNIGIKKSKTPFVFILNPDVEFKKNTFKNLIKSVKEIKDFSILSPLNSNLNFPNYSQEKINYINKNILQVNEVDGFSMLINKKNISEKNFFDENFFLYLENNDVCKRLVKKNQKIYIIKNSLIKHHGASSTISKLSTKKEYLRNWHWMWSKFYYNKKHYGYFLAFFKILPNLMSSFLKLLFFSFFDIKKKTIYKMRFSGIINSILLKKSWLRIEDIS
tara:strand:- start:239 stop:1099 length:861 start_codon:yes stop_codon:yes gene_type:complete